MKIQVIGKTQKIKCFDCEITYSKFDDPRTLDSFDVNIIDLQDEGVWRHDDDTPLDVNVSCDLLSIRKNIETSNKAINIIAFPQNYNFKYNYYGTATKSASYHGSFYLKNKLDCVKRILDDIIPKAKIMGNPNTYDIAYENSITMCKKSKFSSAFYFSDFLQNAERTKANDSDKVTTISIMKNCYLTTLLLSDENTNLMDYLADLGIKETGVSDIPDWISRVHIFDDKEQQSRIDSNRQKIIEIENEIEIAQSKLKDNLKYKSILYTNGNELVNVVFDILQKLLKYNLSSFKDEKKEDFLVKLDNITYIGEIKGVNTNVKSEYISQLDVNYQTYLDKLNETAKTENVKSLLIINAQRNKPIFERESIHENQIKLARRNGCLIIPTIELLKLFEKFTNGEIETHQVIEIFTTQIGLIDISKL